MRLKSQLSTLASTKREGARRQTPGVGELEYEVKQVGAKVEGMIEYSEYSTSSTLYWTIGVVHTVRRDR